MSFSRRAFCKSIAGMSIIPFVGAATPAAEAASYSPALQGSGIITLNIYLHGMFAVVFDNAKKTVQLLPPLVGGSTPHIYVAGDMQGPLLALVQGETYGSDIKTIDSMFTVGSIDPTRNVVIKLSDHQPSGADPYCTICLPWPNAFYPLRPVKPKNATQYIFDRPDGLVKPPKSVPLVSMLQYQIPVVGKSYYMKYHYYAEPHICPTEFHTTEAFHQLKLLYRGLDTLKVNSDLGLHDIQKDCEAIPIDQIGVTPEDELALVEWLGLNCDDADYQNVKSLTDVGENCSEDTIEKPTTAQGKKEDSKPRKLIDSRGRPLRTSGGQFGIHPTACMSMIAI